MARVHEELASLEAMLALTGELVPRDPRRQLFELAVRVGGMEPARARQAIDGMDDAAVASKLAEWPTLSQGEPARTTPGAGEEMQS